MRCRRAVACLVLIGVSGGSLGDLTRSLPFPLRLDISMSDGRSSLSLSCLTAGRRRFIGEAIISSESSDSTTCLVRFKGEIIGSLSSSSPSCITLGLWRRLTGEDRTSSSSSSESEVGIGLWSGRCDLFGEETIGSSSTSLSISTNGGFLFCDLTADFGFPFPRLFIIFIAILYNSGPLATFDGRGSHIFVFFFGI